VKERFEDCYGIKESNLEAKLHLLSVKYYEI
jgi:hypothetical protein